METNTITTKQLELIPAETQQKRVKPTIKNWCKEDQPHYKLLSRGKTALASSELISLILRDGNSEMNVVDLSKKLLIDSNYKLKNLSMMSVRELIKLGLTELKATTLLAAFELGKRYYAEEAEYKEQITDSNHIYDLLKPLMLDLQVEEFWVIYLNRANRVIKKVRISEGGVTGTVADIKVIFKTGIELLASSIILAHNHPSGSLKPSHADIEITKKLKETGNIMEIAVLDHIIFTNIGYYSFADEGMI